MSLLAECRVTTFRNAVRKGQLMMTVEHCPTGIIINRQSMDSSVYALKRSIMLDLEKQMDHLTNKTP